MERANCQQPHPEEFPFSNLGMKFSLPTKVHIQTTCSYKWERSELRICMVGGVKEARQRQTVFLPSMYHHSFSSERLNFRQGFLSLDKCVHTGQRPFGSNLEVGIFDCKVGLGNLIGPMQKEKERRRRKEGRRERRKKQRSKENTSHPSWRIWQNHINIMEKNPFVPFLSS